MQSPAFLPHLPLSRRSPPPPLRPACLSATCPLRRPASATLSLPQNHAHGRMRSVSGSLLHTEETKRKIGQSVLRRAEMRRARLHHFMLSLRDNKLPSDQHDDEHDDEPVDTPRKPRRRLSAESRAKISAALKGRRKSPAHREALRARFEGDRNPMYGRKLSKESRAKISAAMAGRAKKKRDDAASTEATRVSDDAITDLRDKAAKSRLFNEPIKTLTTKKRSSERKLEEQAEAREIEELLTRVARLDKPPENVARTLETNRRMREEEVEEEESECVTCERCKATGFVKCPECVGAFGVASARCEGCFGAGAVFCETCQGVGELAEGGVC